MRRIVVLAVGLLVVLGAVPASAAPDVVRQRTCSDGARSRLELTIGRAHGGGRLKVRFEVHRSPVGHRWRITIHAFRIGFLSPNPVIEGTRVANDSGVLVAQVHPPGWGTVDRVVGEAVDRQTDQFCRVNTGMIDLIQ